MQLKTIVVFPYSGYAKGTARERLFWKLVEHCREIGRDSHPVVVLNADTERCGGATAFRRDFRSSTVETHRVWSVDTCQMRLAGWGYVLDKYASVKRII